MSTPPVAFYADFQGLAGLRNDARAQDPDALKEAARQFESLFTQMLLKSMREATRSFGESMFGSDSQAFYQDMFDDQIAMQLSSGRGLGLADMLVQQLTRERLAAAIPGEPPAGHESGEAAEASAPLEASPTFATRPSARAPGEQHAALAASRTEFVRALWPHAQQAGRELGVDPHALLAQAALETGWGRSVPCNPDGSCSYNLFGIKAGSQWSGPTVSLPTLEFEEGIPVRKLERFRAYGSPAESFRDYAALIRNNARYEPALGTGGDVPAFAAALQRGGYATDPAYAQKIVAIANQLRAELKTPGERPIRSGGA